MSERRLVSTERRVPRTAEDRYDAAWTGVLAAASARSAHAWRFRSAGEEGLFVEFLEFRAGADPREDPPLRRALDELERISAGLTREWLDASTRSHDTPHR
jgi:hypothetical protein